MGEIIAVEKYIDVEDENETLCADNTNIYNAMIGELRKEILKDSNE